MATRWKPKSCSRSVIASTKELKPRFCAGTIHRLRAVGVAGRGRPALHRIFSSSLSRFAPFRPLTLNLLIRGNPMLVVMQAQAAEEQIRAGCQKIEELGY